MWEKKEPYFVAGGPAGWYSHHRTHYGVCGHPTLNAPNLDWKSVMRILRQMKMYVLNNAH